MTTPPTGTQPSVVVAGDVCLDVVGVPMPRHACRPDGSCENWRLAGETRTHYLRGGAFLLADFVRHAIAQPVAGPVVLAPEALRRGKGDAALADQDLPRLTRADMVHSILELQAEKDKKDDDGPGTLRVHSAHGYSGPETMATALPVSVAGDPPAARMVVIDDTGNGFRNRCGEWPKSLTESSGVTLVIYKLHRPIPEAHSAGSDAARRNELWDLLRSRPENPTVVVTDINDLRAEGAMISKCLSWEKTTLELLWHLRGDPRLAALRDCRHLIVRMDTDAAVYWHNPGPDGPCVAWLLYDPRGLEGGFARTCRGLMVGLGSAFTAALAAALLSAVKNPAELDPKWDDVANRHVLPEPLRQGIVRGLAAARRLLSLGFGEASKPPHYPGEELFKDLDRTASVFASIQVPIFSDSSDPDPQYWTILDRLFPRGSQLDMVAAETVLRKKVPTLKDVPIGVFGKLSTYDRREIEAYSSLSNLLRDYLGNPAPKRPLSIAVFGAPGSGKSFGIQQVAEHVKGDAKIQPLTFNLSQFQNPEDLPAALHLVRDSVVKGSVPLVFFDEFDARFDGGELGWLKHFLSPMQDGEFVDRGSTHPIGKAIFIFAGGTCERYEDFKHDPPAVMLRAISPTKKGAPDAEPSDAPDMIAYAAFKNAKGPDFVSRLRGRLNIPRIDFAPGMPTAAVLLRRAGILRLQLQARAPRLLDSDGDLQIDPGVLRAFLYTPAFQHGVRSMEAILDMSNLAGCDLYSPSCLPQPDQLEIHVDKDAFRDLVLRPDPFGPDLDKVAKAIHDDYLAERKKDGTYNANTRSHKPWEGLDVDLRDSNREQARAIPHRLAKAGLFIRKISSDHTGTPVKLDKDLVEVLAREEHERWVAEKLRQGWVFGPKRDDARRIHPCLVPWEDVRLGDEQKNKDRQAISAMGKLVAAAGYEVVAKAR